MQYNPEAKLGRLRRQGPLRNSITVTNYNLVNPAIATS
jgi:hypothetical protein